MPRPAKLGPHDPPGVGPYTFLARLGRGGQGEVYLAADDDGDRVAVKVLRVDWDASGVLKRNLDRELVNARKVAPFVTAKVVDFDVVGEVPYIVSEYIEGLTLAERVRESGPLRGSELLLVASQALTALEAIHQARIIHCDFKPANIILGPGGARVIDFGIAQALDSTHRAGIIAGTFPFMAPEQFRDEPLTSAADLFSWGATFVFAATGQEAFPGERREEIAQRILTQSPELHDIEEPLRTVVRAGLQKRPERRPTAAQARRMLLGPSRKAAPGIRAATRPPGVPMRRPTGPALAPRAAAAPRPAPTRIAAPVADAEPAPPSAIPNTGRDTWKRVAALAAAVATAVAIGLVWVVPQKSGDPSADSVTTGTGSAPDTSPTPSGEVGALAAYQRYWSDASCVSDEATSNYVIRQQCPISQDGVKLKLICVLYIDRNRMALGGRPAGGDNNITKELIDWRNEWYRSDSDVHGDFIAYRLPNDSAAIWWEDSAEPVACMLHGPPGTTSTLVAAFIGHGFGLRAPTPPGR